MGDIRCDISLDPQKMQTAHWTPLHTERAAIEIDSFGYSFNQNKDLAQAVMSIDLVVHDAANAVEFTRAMFAKETLGFGLYMYASVPRKDDDQTPVWAVTSDAVTIKDIQFTASESSERDAFYAKVEVARGEISMGIVSPSDGNVTVPAGSTLRFGPL